MVVYKVKEDFYYDTMSQLGELRQNSLLCDVTLTVGQDTLAVHRCVLATGSQYFRSLFLGQFKEASMHNVNMSDVTDDVKDLELVVNFMYSGEIDINNSNLGVLVQLSSFLLIDSLREFCTEYMMKHLCLKNCLRYYLHAHMYGLTSVEENAHKMVGFRFHDYIMFDDNLELTPKEVVYLVDNGLFAHFSALKIVNFVALWLKNKVTEEHIAVANHLLDKVAIESGSVEIAIPVAGCRETIETMVPVACGKETMEPGVAIESVVLLACDGEAKETVVPVTGGKAVKEKVVPVAESGAAMETVVPVKDGIETVVPVDGAAIDAMVPVTDGTETVVPVTNGGAAEQQNLAEMAVALQGQGGAGARRLLEKAKAIYAETDSKQGASVAENKTFMDEEEVLVTLSPKQCLVDIYIPFLSEDTLMEPVLDLCCYVPRTKTWYHIRDLKPWETGYFSQSNDDTEIYLHQLFINHLTTFMYKEELVMMDGDWASAAEIHFYNIRNKSNRQVTITEPDDIMLGEDEALRHNSFSYCFVTDDHSLYFIYKVHISDEIEHDIVGEYFRCVRLEEDGWETVFRTDIERNRAFAGGILQAKISSVSNEMIFTCGPNIENGISNAFVVDLNKEHPVPVNVFTMVTEESDQVLTGVKITQTSTHFYIVQDGTMDSMDGNVQIMLEYEFNSQRLTEPEREFITVDHLRTFTRNSWPYMEEMAAASDNTLWLFQGADTFASVLTEYETKSDGSVARRVHTPPPFFYMTAMFNGKLAADLLKDATPIERFLLSGTKTDC